MVGYRPSKLKRTLDTEIAYADPSSGSTFSAESSVLAPASPISGTSSSPISQRTATMQVTTASPVTFVVVRLN